MVIAEIVPLRLESVELLPAAERDSLVSWLNLYMGLEAGANAENTIQAKKRDLRLFVEFFNEATGCVEVDL